MSEDQERSWKGSPEQQERAPKTMASLEQMLGMLTKEELAGVQAFCEFWQENNFTGHKNIFRMLPLAIMSITKNNKDT